MFWCNGKGVDRREMVLQFSKFVKLSPELFNLRFRGQVDMKMGVFFISNHSLL